MSRMTEKKAPLIQGWEPWPPWELGFLEGLKFHPKPKFSLSFKIEINMKDLTFIIDLCSLKNVCSVNISLKFLIWSVQALNVLLFLSK